MIRLELIEEAYRKLKGSVYWDKTLPFLRASIVAWENENLDGKMQDLCEAINNLAQWEALEKSILDSIEVLSFPKKILDNGEQSDNPIIISNVCADAIQIEKYNNFINMSVEGHILGVLWILLVGYKMDKILYNCYGNRLCETLVFNEEETTASPNLFKPYFSQYESWRNQGLKKAEEIVNKENDSVIITMLDLTRYYYNVRINEDSFRKMTEVYMKDSDGVSHRINTLIYKIMKHYSEMLDCHAAALLPIGFLPANILANIYLQEFDRKIALCDSVEYYGRYVDDMLIVTRINAQKSKLYFRIRNKGINEVGDYMLKLLQGENIIGQQIIEKNRIPLQGYDELSVQKDKLRFFYVDKNGYDMIVEKIRKDIAQNTSEFNYLPEEVDAELDVDILKLERDDTVNKLRGVRSVSVDKYALSKAIGKNVMMSKFAEEKAIKAFAESIDQLLKNRELISNYTLWENILNYYVLNRKWGMICGLSKAIFDTLGKMDEQVKKIDDYAYLRNPNIETVGDSLILFYNSCLARSTAIVWGKEIQKMLRQIEEIARNQVIYTKYNHLFEVNRITKLRKYYCNSRMISKNLLPVSIEECMSSSRPTDVADRTRHFYLLDEYLNAKDNVRFSKKTEKYAPYIVSPFEIMYTHLLRQIKSGVTELSDDIACIDEMKKSYANNFKCFNHQMPIYFDKEILCESFNYEGDIKVSVRSSWNNQEEKCKIAVANVKMCRSDIIDILERKKRDISGRCSEIGRIVNEAKRYKSDILVFPEACIPITYLPLLQAKAAKSNMTIIGGLEHIRYNNLVYNLTVTIIPCKTKKYGSYALPFFHPKMYYSPEEMNDIERYKCKPVVGKTHTLFDWKGIRFATYCCYELTSIVQRSKFLNEVDIVFGVEWNRDTKYFGNIMESLSRDLSCFCVQSNMSEYGDSRIIQPTRSIFKDIAKVKGGINSFAIIGEVDIEGLRKHRKTGCNGDFKPLPAGFLEN